MDLFIYFRFCYQCLKVEIYWVIRVFKTYNFLTSEALYFLPVCGLTVFMVASNMGI